MKQGVKGFEWTDVSQFEKICLTFKLKLLSKLLCILPGQRSGTAKDGEWARPGRLLIRYVQFDPHIKGLEIKAIFKCT